MLDTIERNKGFTVILLGAAIVLLIFVTAALDSRVLSLHVPDIGRTPTTQAAVDRYAELFLAASFTNLVAEATDRDVFDTRYFDKPRAKPLPEPGTRDVPVKFMGSMLSSEARVTAFLQVDNQLKILGPGETIIHDWRIASVTGDLLVLTNAESATNSVAFEQTLQLTIPIR